MINIFISLPLVIFLVLISIFSDINIGTLAIYDNYLHDIYISSIILLSIYLYLWIYSVFYSWQQIVATCFFIQTDSDCFWLKRLIHSHVIWLLTWWDLHVAFCCLFFEYLMSILFYSSFVAFCVEHTFLVCHFNF